MSGPFEHPSLRFLVTEEQRDRALNFLQDAFAKGRIDEAEFDDRMGQALAARTRKELNAAFLGLVHIPISTGSVSPAPATGSAVASNIGSGFLHWSQVVGYVIPPVIAFGVAEKGSRARREATQAILFTLVSTAGILLSYFLLPGVFAQVGAGIFALLWVLGVVIGGARAITGKTAYPFLPGAANQPKSKKPLGR